MQALLKGLFHTQGRQEAFTTNLPHRVTPCRSHASAVKGFGPPPIYLPNRGRLEGARRGEKTKRQERKAKGQEEKTNGQEEKIRGQEEKIKGQESFLPANFSEK